jgi:protein TonB
MRGAQDSSPAQAAFLGVRTILVPPDIVAVQRRSPLPVRKRTPWRPQPDGQAITERPGARDWFSDRLFVEGQDDHARSGYSASIAVHLCGAAILVGVLLTQTVGVPVVRAGSSLVMPVMMSVLPTTGVLPAPRRSSEPKPLEPARPHEETSAAQAAEAAPAPIDAPSSITPETGAEPGVDGAASGVSGSGAPTDGAAETSAAGSSGSGATGPYRIGGTGGIMPPRKIKDVKPVYPLEALSARARGNVIIEATIGADGKVQHTSVVHSIATLDQAAVDAVRQWEYAPSMLNGVAVAVIMLVVVNFTIQ